MSVVEVEGVGGLPKLFVESADKKTSCDIYLWGATLTSWVQSGRERIFVSDSAIFNSVKAIRGGIPLVFPQFGQPLSSMSQHGFARTSLWTHLSTESTDAYVSVRLGLTSSEATLAVWPHEFSLEYNVILTENTLTCTLKVNNSGSSSFQCHTLLHTYLRLDHITNLRVRGFQGCKYSDKLLGGAEHDDTREEATIDRETDRVYQGPVPAIHVQDGEAAAVVVEKFASLQVEGQPLLQVPCDVVFWNPWIDKARSLADLGEQSYPHFVCVEPGTVSDWVTVPAAATLTLTQMLHS